jgi:hypothetical protein
MSDIEHLGSCCRSFKKAAPRVDPLFDFVMKDSRSLDQSAQQILRIKAVKALIGGKTQGEVAELFDVSLKAINNWWKIYRELDPAKMAKLVANPIIIDGRNALDREAWIAAGWKFRALGRAN